MEEKEMELAFNLFDHVQRGSIQLLGTLEQTLHWVSEVDRGSRILEGHVRKGGELDAVCCDREYLDMVAGRLRDEGIPCISGTARIDGKEVGIISTRDADREQLRKIIDRAREEIEPGGVKPRRMVENLSVGRARVIAGLDIPEAMLFARYAEAAKINIAVDEVARDSRSVVYPSQYVDEMKEMKHHVAQAFSGAAGRALRKQLRYEHQNYLRVADRVYNYDRRKGEFYVMGMSGPQMYVREQDVRVYGNDGMEVYRFDRSDPAFGCRVRQVFDRIRHPVDLTAQEYGKIAGADHKSRIRGLKEADRSHGRPDFTRDEVRELALQRETQMDEAMRRKTQLYEKKLALDNPERIAYQYSYLDDEMGMPEFETMEHMNRDALREEQEERGDFDGRGEGCRVFDDHEEELDAIDLGIQDAVLDGREPEREEGERSVEEYGIDDLEV